MLRVDSAKLKADTKQLEKNIIKQRRAASGRAIRRTMEMVLTDVKNNTPVVTGVLRKSWRKYSNILKGGDGAYGHVYVDPAISYIIKDSGKIVKNKKGNTIVKPGTKMKSPFKYAFKTELKRKFVKRSVYSNRIKWTKSYLKYLAENV